MVGLTAHDPPRVPAGDRGATRRVHPARLSGAGKRGVPGTAGGVAGPACVGGRRGAAAAGAHLHDGAQQRLISLALSLRHAQKIASDSVAAELLRAASNELAVALDELRELARGIHPAVLTERGLGPALQSLADRASLPVEIELLVEERLPARVEAAAYYVVSEALGNVAKHANASGVAVSMARGNGLAIVEVTDDGVGGADPRCGSGLRGLSDRIEALDGTLTVHSPSGEGTMLHAEVPCS
jgi:signal transduction histidine kinase